MAFWKRRTPILCCLLLFGWIVLVDGSARAFTSRPVQDVIDAPIFSGGGAKLTIEEIGDAIWAGAVDKGWQPEKVANGRFSATIFVRSHMAKVDIAFGAERYSITYSDSENLNYNGRTIHRNYNRWVANLRAAIDRRLIRR